jgi:hypothetical protein
MVISHDKKITLNDLRSLVQKGKVTVTLTLKSFTPNNLRNLSPTVFIFGMEVDNYHKVSAFDFEVIRSKVKNTGALIKNGLSAQLLKNALVNSLHIWY